MKSRFSVDFISNSQYEYLTAEISFGGQILCEINKDQGSDNMEIEFFHEQRILDHSPEMKFLIREFFSIIEEVTAELSEE